MTKNVLVVIEDLFFAVKIQDAAKRNGATVKMVKDYSAALEAAKTNPAVIVLDLNCQPARPLELAAALKAEECTSSIPLIGFVSHVMVELRNAAAAAGCDKVYARSKFSADLPEILAVYLHESNDGPGEFGGV